MGRDVRGGLCREGYAGWAVRDGVCGEGCAGRAVRAGLCGKGFVEGPCGKGRCARDREVKHGVHVTTCEVGTQQDTATQCTMLASTSS